MFPPVISLYLSVRLNTVISSSMLSSQSSKGVGSMATGGKFTLILNSPISKHPLSPLVNLT